MANLLKKKQETPKQDGIRIVQEVLKEQSGLEYVGFKLIEMDQGAIYEEQTGTAECCIVAVTGKLTVSEGKESYPDIGTRKSVFEKKPTDAVYISNDRSFRIEAVSDATVAFCYSPSEKQLPTRLIPADSIAVLQRGSGANQRLVHDILPETNPAANSLLVVEVYTESGNWSSYPPHKHDQDNLPEESFLEETYYHEMDPPQGFVFQRVYTDERDLDETMAVENQDVVVVPKGYHPVGVPAGYTSYYLNVMAGPKRIWKFHNDPDHEWMLK
ncbi:5-deoxy-glucuronate isomerase [Terribacillus sp. 179-K 1B1 HS]|uniref:5-deoxy-glucuronate isomerase n=1 Tax=Terribacillus sp. 179-K 1B1 HS TaxID=3142388 RepID=UPI0039A12193